MQAFEKLGVNFSAPPLLSGLLCAAIWLSCQSLSFAEQPHERPAKASEKPAPPIVTEIVVHGANIPEPLADLPASASVIDTGAEATRGADHFQDVLAQVPGLNWAAGTSRPNFFQIRGVGEVEQYEGAPNPSVGVIIDDIDLSSLGAAASLFDIEQAEVLRGPQSIRYGSNALAGVVALHSMDPTPYFSSHAEISGGSDDLIAGGLAVGGPVDGSDGKLQFRMSAFEHSSDGFRQNDFLGRDDTNKRDEFTSRLKLRYAPSSDLKIDLTGMLLRFHNGYDAFAIDNSLHTQSDRPGEDGQQTQAGALRITGELSPELELSSITSASGTHTDYSYDGDWGNNPFWGQFAPYDYFSSSHRVRRVFSQELRLGTPDRAYQHGETNRWVAGLFGQRFSEHFENDNYSDNALYDQLNSNYRAYAGAVFGEYEYALGSASALRLGLRGESRSTTYDDSRGHDDQPSYLMWGGSLSLDHDFSDLESADAMRGYFTLSRGFKGGGINASLNVPEDRRKFTPESLYNAELGLKSTLWGGRFSSSVAAYATLRRNIQTRLSFQSDPSDPLTFIYITDNAARGRTVGIETELRLQASRRLSFRLAGNIMQATITAANEDDANLEGRDQTHAPRWQYFANATYFLTDHFFTRIDLSGVDSFYFQDSHNARSAPYHLLGAALGYEAKHWTWTVWGRNLGDTNYAVRGFYFGDEPPDFPTKKYIQRGDPLQVGTTFSYYF